MQSHQSSRIVYVAGAFYGVRGIPGHWLERLALRAEIEELAGGLYRASQS